MFTEEEAKTKWCPHIQFHGNPEHGGGSNRPNQFTGDCFCLGFVCMAWRFGVDWDHDTPEAHRPGYCGLAGKPDEKE